MFELDKWIEGKYLEKHSFREYQSFLSKSLEEGIVLDDFFKSEKMKKIENFVRNEAEFREEFILYSAIKKTQGDEEDKRQELSQNGWNSAKESDKFSYRKQVSWVKPGYEMSKNWLTYLMFRDFLMQSFPSYIKEVTGLKLDCGTVFIDVQDKENFLKKHNDVKTGRKLCLILYLSEGWEEEYGGKFCMALQDGSIKKTDAFYNRLVIFSPSNKTAHYVEPNLTDDQSRICLVAWFNEVNS